MLDVFFVNQFPSDLVAPNTHRPALSGLIAISGTGIRAIASHFLDPAAAKQADPNALKAGICDFPRFQPRNISGSGRHATQYTGAI